MKHPVPSLLNGVRVPVEVSAVAPAPARSAPRRELRRTGEPDVLFVTGHRRSGTTWLTSMLNAHPLIHVRNEGWLFNELPVPPSSSSPRRWHEPNTARDASFEHWIDDARFDTWANRREARGTWLRDISPRDARALMQRAMFMALLREATIRENWKDWSKLAYIGDKTTIFYLTKIDAVHRIFPNATIINLLRDGRDSVVSNMFLLFRENRIHELPHAAQDPARRAFEFHVNGRGSPVPLFSLESLVYFTTEWLKSVIGAARAKSLYGDSFLEIRYEELVRDQNAKLSACFDCLGVPCLKEQLETIIEQCRFERFSQGRPRGTASPLAEFRKGTIGDWRNYFTQDDKAVFKQVAGAMLIELGHEPSMEW